MINWFEKLFKEDKLSEDIGKVILPPVNNILPMPEVKPCKPDIDISISEPVLSFIKCVRENPKRFVVKSDYEYFGLKISDSLVIRSTEPERYHFCLEDKVTKESWTLCKDIVLSFYPGFKETKHTYNPEWLTEDEKEYLITSIKTIFHDRRHRKEKLQDIRKQRRIRDERNRLKEIYK